MTLNILIVDDEALARQRLRTLLSDCADPPTQVVAEAADAVTAMGLLARQPCHVVLLDIHMPGMDGLGLAQALQQLPQPPAVVFVTAHAEHALQAFDLEALDYLTKPVRLERLQAALKKAERTFPIHKASEGNFYSNFILIQDRGRTERVPLADVVYLKAELKYVTVRTRSRTSFTTAAWANSRHATGPTGCAFTATRWWLATRCGRW
jgi:two-component system response regulator AlgR